MPAHVLTFAVAAPSLRTWAVAWTAPAPFAPSERKAFCPLDVRATSMLDVPSMAFVVRAGVLPPGHTLNPFAPDSKPGSERRFAPPPGGTTTPPLKPRDDESPDEDPPEDEPPLIDKPFAVTLPSVFTTKARLPCAEGCKLPPGWTLTLI